MTKKNCFEFRIEQILFHFISTESARKKNYNNIFHSFSQNNVNKNGCMRNFEIVNSLCCFQNLNEMVMKVVGPKGLTKCIGK